MPIGPGDIGDIGDLGATGEADRGGNGRKKKRKSVTTDAERNVKGLLDNPTAKDSLVASAPVIKPKVGTAGLESEVKQRRERQATVRRPRRASILSGITDDEITGALLGRPRGR